MNKERRKELKKARILLEEAREIIQAVRDEEEEAYDNMPESFQDSERGETMMEYIYILEGVDSGIEEAEDSLDDICG